MRIEVPADRWYSGQATEYVQTRKLTTGQIVIADRKPFRIDRVTELATDQWPDKFVTAWREEGMPDAGTWSSRPYRVSGLWESPGADNRLYTTTAPGSHTWRVLPEHYSVCRLCQELPPCSHVHNDRIADRATERMNQDMAILPGACHGCREPITRRQKHFTFPGPNLIRPDFGDNTAVFHTRGSCYRALTSYDERWAGAEPGRVRFFFCEGTVIHHHGGTLECDRDDCVAKGAIKDLVDHRCQVWHHPDAPRSVHDACWCVKGGA